MKIYVWEILSGNEPSPEEKIKAKYVDLEVVNEDWAVLHGEIEAYRMKPFARHVAEQKFPNMKKCKLIAENGEELEFVPDPPLNNGSYVNWELLAKMTDEDLNASYDDLRSTFSRR